jgi:hypothetical protein
MTEDKMKKGYLKKKLNLNKQTIAHLASGEMRGIHGGNNGETADRPKSSHPVPTCDLCPETLGTQDTLNTDPTDP